MKRALAILLVAVVLIAVLVLRRSVEEAAPPPEARPAPPATPRVTASHAPSAAAPRGAPLLGVNEGLTLPPSLLMRLGGTASARATMARRTQMLRQLGAGVVRANNHLWPHLNLHQFRGFDDADAFVTAAGAAGVDAIVVLGPWPGMRTAAVTPRYVPDDLDALAAWVRSVVERYDGDGVEDMPGLVRPVLAWEMDNEPDIHWRVLPDGGVRDQEKAPFGTPEEYVRVLLAMSGAVRAADPDATILLGGMFNPGTVPGTRDYLMQVLAEPGAREAFDALSVHVYFAADSLEPIRLTMQSVRALLPGARVWVTETSVPGLGEWDEEWQARMVPGVVGAFLADGAERVLWHTLVDPPADQAERGHHGFHGNSLFRVEEDEENRERIVRKPAGDVFRRLAGHLADATHTDVAEVPAEGGRLLETPSGWLAFWGEPALPPGAGAVEDLLTGEPTDRATAPAWIAR